MERWEPFRGAMTLRDAMDRLFQESMVRPEAWRGGGGIAMDVDESDDAYTVCASLPGWKPEDVNLTVQQNTVTISGQHKPAEQKEDRGRTYHLRERRFESFSRSFSFPTPVDADKADAKFEGGELTLTLPKAESAKPRQIKINGREQPAMQQPAAVGKPRA